MENLFAIIDAFLGNSKFLLVVSCVAFALKAYIIASLVSSGLKSPKTSRSWLFLALVVISSMIADSAWILTLSEQLFFPGTIYKFRLFWTRIAWGFNVVQYQALALFLSFLSERSSKIRLHQKLLGFISFCLWLFFIGLAIININCAAPSHRPAIEFFMLKAEALYVFAMMGFSLIMIFFQLRKKELPRILNQQLNILITYLVAPHLISDILQTFPFQFSSTYFENSLVVTSLSTLLLTLAIYYCSRKIVGLRFLNFKSHVQSSSWFNFIDDFKNVLEQMSQVTNLKELTHITQNFFKDAFNIPLNKTTLYIRSSLPHTTQEELPQMNAIERTVENFLSMHEHNKDMQEISAFIAQTKILTYDEVAFSNFYEENNSNKTILQFLDRINADFFVPIYQQTDIIGYIIVERFARDSEFYSDVERDEILVFSSYLGNIINLLQNRSLNNLLHKEKEMREELYYKHQELNQYKESIRSFMRATPEKEIGIIFYKNRHFTFGNKTAKEMIQINLNTQEGHPLAKTFKKIAHEVHEYKTSQTTFAKDAHGNKIVLAGIPNLEGNNIIITVYYPEISDIIKKQIDLLADPTKWDYLLHLETTRSGKLINQLIPSSGETLLNFKIDLLRTALSKKATLIDVSDDDLLPTVELLHHIGLRESLHVLKLQEQTNNYDIAIRLFGINPLLGQQTEQPLLKRLDRTGTLFIQNIHLLDVETQNYLAEFIRYGFYRIFKSDKKVTSDVRIICSTHQNLDLLVQEGTFSQALLNELYKTSLCMPSPLTLSAQELGELADGFTEQALKGKEFSNLLALTPRDKERIIHRHPTSLKELKTAVQALLIDKSKKNEIFHETQFDPAYGVSDPELVEAARLGKQALRDAKTMTLLWHKFKNQNKIAAFLGVNRSSINRRCKEYNLE